MLEAPANFPITHALIGKMSNAWLKYEADRVARIGLKEEEKKSESKRKGMKRQRSEIDNNNSD